MYPKILPEVRGGAQRAEGSVVLGQPEVTQVTPILLPLFLSQLILHKQLPYCMHSHFTGTDARRVRPLSIGMSQQNVQLIKDAL